MLNADGCERVQFGIIMFVAFWSGLVSVKNATSFLNLWGKACLVNVQSLSWLCLVH